MEVKKFKTGIEVYDTYTGVPGPSGDTVRKRYKISIRDGVRSLISLGDEDIQSYIDSFRDTTSVAAIMRRLLGGDFSPLSQRKPVYGDSTAIPQDIHDIKKSIDFLRLKYEKEPEYIKKQFPTYELYVQEMYNNSGKNYIAALVQHQKEELKSKEGDQNNE